MDTSDGKRTAVVIGVAGILIELVTVLLLASHRISSSVATPVIILGMLMAFVPLFLAARRAKR